MSTLPNTNHSIDLKKIALIELGNSHDECLYSQYFFLQTLPNVTVEFMVTPAIAQRLRKSLPQALLNEVPANFTWSDLLKLKAHLLQEKFSVVIFNTAQIKQVHKLLLLLPKKIQCYGLIHNLEKLDKSLSQKISSRKIKHYFALHPYLVRNYAKSKYREKITALLAIFQPQTSATTLPKAKNEIWLTIPGQVELKRRDYDSLFRSIRHYGLKPNHKLIFLGKSTHRHGDGDYVRKCAAKLQIQHQSLFWDHHVPTDLFNAYLQQSDLVLPLINPRHPSWKIYQRQISGAFNSAWSFHKWSLIDEALLAMIPEFNGNALTYSNDQIMRVINNLTWPLPKPDYSAPFWSFDFQKEQYLKTLGLR